MKILFPIGFFYPAIVGGPSSTVYWLTNYLAANGIDVVVVATDCKLNAEQHGIKLNQSTPMGNHREVFFCRTRIMALPCNAVIRIIKELAKVDVVHYSSIYSYLTIYTVFVAVLLRKNVFISPRGELFTCAIDSFKKKILLYFFRMLVSKVTFHSTSEDETKSILALYPKAKIVQQPNFIDCALSLPPKERTLDIVFLGIIYPVKRIENIIEALAASELFHNSKSIFRIIGAPLRERDFVYKATLEKLIAYHHLEDKIVWMGEMQGPEKLSCLNRSHVLVLPSEAENFGNVVVEALAQSVPVIAAIGTPWEILNTTNSGWWCDCSPQGLRKTIETALMLNENEYMTMCRNARELVRERFSIYTSKNNHWLRYYQENRAL